LEEQVTAALVNAEEKQSMKANIAYKAVSAQYRKTLNASVRDSWVKKTESLNLDRDDRKLWRLAKVLNNEDCRSKETAIQLNGKMVTGEFPSTPSNKGNHRAQTVSQTTCSED
jgi:hypothetical protein